jgi:membrane fusion protein (multidrug efflux system)
MKRSLIAAVVALVAVAAGGGWWWKSHHGADAAAATAAAAAAVAPVASVRSEIAKMQAVAETLEVLGDVAPGQSSGLSFARAGQITQLAVVVGDRVKKDQVLATLVPDPAVRQAYQQAVDAVALTRRERDRQAQLLASQLATQSQLDAAEKALRDAQGALTALDQQGGGNATSQLLAPFDGVVAAVSALQGDRVQAAAAVLQIGRDDALRATLGIEPGDRARVKAGTPVTLRAVGAPESQAPVALRVSEVQNAVDPKTQLVGVVVQLPRALAPQFAPGMKVQAQLQVGSLQSVAVPRNAVLTDEQGDYVFQVDAGKAHRVKVTRRLDNGTLVAVTGLANLALPVVVEGNYELEDGMAVKDAAP